MISYIVNRASTIPWVLLIVIGIYTLGSSFVEIKQSLLVTNDSIAYHDLTRGLIAGAITLAALCYLLCSLITKDPSYRHLGGYSLTSLAVILLTANWLQPAVIVEGSWQQTWLPASAALMLYLYAQHSRYSLKSDSVVPNYLFCTLLNWPLLLVTAALLLIPTNIAWLVVGAISLLSGVVISAFLLKLTYLKNKPACGLLFSMLWLLSCLVMALLNYHGIVTAGISNSSMIQLGLVGQLLALYLISYRRFSQQYQGLLTAKSQAQATISTQAEQLNLEQQQSEALQLDLEAVVSERTFELNMTLRELQETNRRLEEQSTIDALTGVKNRKFFNLRYAAEQLLSRRQQTPLSLLLLDADHFKRVNDNYGHIAGDQVLIEICLRATRVLKRPSDNVCRYGGEEFAVLLPNTDSLGAEKVAQAICQEIAATPIAADSNQLEITVSIGVSTTIVAPTLHPDALLAAADKALYLAKNAGRNQVAIAESIDNN